MIGFWVLSDVHKFWWSLHDSILSVQADGLLEIIIWLVIMTLAIDLATFCDTYAELKRASIDVAIEYWWKVLLSLCALRKALTNQVTYVCD